MIKSAVELGIIRSGTLQDAPVGALLGVEPHFLPANFPLSEWNEQSERYAEYWRWFSGKALAEVAQSSTDAEDILFRYPLHINLVRKVARVHAAILFGESPDNYMPLVKTMVSPKTPLDGSSFFEEDQKLAMFLENAINEVWVSSNGRAIQMENGILSQFLGGNVFQISYQPWNRDLLIPIAIKSVRPDYFMPIFSNENPWSLLEAFVIFRIPAAIAKKEYGVDIGNNDYAIYVEHWTRDKYSITINGEPVVLSAGGSSFTFKETENPFGIVPFVYIPHMREGDFFGNSIVEDLVGLIKEYNDRMADTGDAVMRSVNRMRFGSNIIQEPIYKNIQGTNIGYIDLGNQKPGADSPPMIRTEEAPMMGDALVNFPNYIMAELRRQSYVPTVADGEDEGSQRSALTLAFRMWPATSHARTERTFWTAGLNQVAKIIGIILSKKSIPGIPKIPEDFMRRVQFAQDWAPQIPRDREQQVNEIILRAQAGHMSLETALQQYGDIRNIKEEADAIRKDMSYKASLSGYSKREDKPGTTPGSGALQSIVQPVARDGLREE